MVELIDYETLKEHKLTVIGHAAGQDELYAYAEVVVMIKDINDNEPRFTQNVYFARAWEGNVFFYILLAVALQNC